MALNPPSQGAVLTGRSFYRLNQVLQSAGDIFEIDNSAQAVYVGPDSDLTEYRLTYFDRDQPLTINTADISVNGPFVGLLAVELDQRIAATGSLARILCQSVELFEPGFVRTDAVGTPIAARSIFVPPVVDVIYSFTPDIPEVPNVRSDRTVRFSQVPFDGALPAEATDILIPTYGRRLITIQAIAGASVELELRKVIFEQGSTPGDSPALINTLAPLTFGGLASPAQRTFVLRSSRDSQGDQNVTAIETIERNPISDTIGFFDYLIISVRRGPVGAGAGILPSLFVKLSDREV